MIDKAILAKYKAERDILFLLKEAQKKQGYLSPELILEISRECEVPVGHLYGLSTFYGFLTTRPLGKNIIRICQSMPCYLRGVDTIARTIEDALGIKPGEITKDGRFSLHWVNCLGTCDQAPAMMVNGQVYGELTASRVIAILKKYR